MSRSIKFRLFNSRTKEWLCGYEELGGFHLLGELVLMGGIMDFSTTDLSNIVAMQYTGINDKNGVEIYEGDILKFPAKDKWSEENYSAFEVFYHDNDCADSHIGFQMNRVHNFGSVAGGNIPDFLPKITSKMVVIGNIHENPELLEDK